MTEIVVASVAAKGEVLTVHGTVDGIPYIGTGWVIAAHKLTGKDLDDYYRQLLIEVAHPIGTITPLKKKIPLWRFAEALAFVGLVITVLVDHLT